MNSAVPSPQHANLARWRRRIGAALATITAAISLFVPLADTPRASGALAATWAPVQPSILAPHLPFVRDFAVGTALPGQEQRADLAIRAANMAIPFVRSEIGLAQPFAFTPRHSLDWTRAVDCLASAAYYEAGQGEADQRAVMQVILNRVRHYAFPHTVCGVVFQGSERHTGCQLTFTCDGSLARRRPSPTAWADARRVASEALAGRTDPAVGIATHYHTDWVLPSWSPQMDKIAAVHTHLFFRWRGSAGASSSLQNAHAGDEPRIAQLAGLSIAHAGLASPQLAMVRTGIFALAPAPAASLPPQIERLSNQTHAPEADTFLILLDGTASPERFPGLARAQCSDQAYCKVIGWTDARKKAEQLPISGAAIDAISFTFVQRGAGPAPEIRWNCREFPRTDTAQCLRRGT
jgi:hypothetical protein